MNWDQIQAEQEAYQSVMALLEQARKCEQLHERAGLALPERVQRLLGITASPGAAKAIGVTRAHIPAPVRRDPPKEATSDWISIPVKDAIVTTVALAVLRGANGEAVRSRDLTAKVMELLPNSTSGSVANAGTRLSAEGMIERSDDGWKLLKPERAAVMRDQLLWGPVTVFATPEIAAHRREAILHILKHYPKGLQTVQIVEQLKGCAWVHAPSNKDMLKIDLQVLLADRKVRRSGNTRKFQIATSENGE